MNSYIYCPCGFGWDDSIPSAGNHVCYTTPAQDESVHNHTTVGRCPCGVLHFLQPTSSPSGKKYDDGKPMMDLLSPIALTEIAKVMTLGANKYGKHNWRSGLSWCRVLAALLRHVLAFLGGEDKDPETGLSHLAHAGCCIMFLLDYEVTHKDCDDRFKG